jgi:CRP-like cAMP-binding protein
MFKKGDFLLSNADLANTVVVVISGAIGIHMRDKLKTEIEFARSTLYPGDHIGAAPLSLILSSSSAYFNLKATLDSDVLLLAKNSIPAILEQEINSLMQEKIFPLQSCSLFESKDLQSPYSFFVLANLITIREYKMSEVIQRQGQLPDGLMRLVVSGQCKAVFESTIILGKQKDKKLKQVRLKHGKNTVGNLGVMLRDSNSVRGEFFK